MSFNNIIYGRRGEVVGFRCVECGGVYQSGFDETCNECRATERRHQEVLRTIRETSRAQPRDPKESAALSELILKKSHNEVIYP